MDHNAQSNGKRIADQSAYTRQYWGYLCAEPSIWFGEWEVLTNAPVVQIKNWPFRQYTNVAGKFVAR